jgi:glycosyltransferase involved in cell wall biosynthesis
MNICVVTPYFNTPFEWMAQAHASVRAQTVAASHILIADGCAQAAIPNFSGTHVVLQRNYGDYGNTPRLIGCYHAIAQNADAIAFLDADNWYYPDHLRALIAHMAAERLEACSSARMLHRLDGSPMLRCPHVDGVRHIDTNCLLVLRPAFPYLIGWVLQGQEVAAEADQRLWAFLRQRGVRTGFLNHASVAYRTRHLVHYTLAGEAPPAGTVNRTDPHGGRYH